MCIRIVKPTVYLIPKVNRFVNHVSVFPHGGFQVKKIAKYVPSEFPSSALIGPRRSRASAITDLIMHVECSFNIQDVCPVSHTGSVLFHIDVSTSLRSDTSDLLRSITRLELFWSANVIRSN